MPFEIGNTLGQKVKVIDGEIRKVLATDDRGRLRKAIEKTLDQAADGSLPHLDWIATRLDGKPQAQVELSATGTLQDALRRIALQPVPDALTNAITIEGTHDATD